MSQANTPQHANVETLNAIKERYQTEYMLKAKTKLAWWNVFRGSDARLKQVENIAASLMQKDIANGTLLARLAEDIAAEENASAISKPTEPTPNPQPVFYHHPEPEDYNVNIPNIPQLQNATDASFLLYVLETLDAYDLRSPGYVECPELKALRRNSIPQGYERPSTLATIVAKKFSITPNGEVLRGENSKNVMLLMHSDTQDSLIKTGIYAIRSYNQHGTIPLHLREEFMIEHTKEVLRMAGHAFTPRYEIFCMNVLHHVLAHMQTLAPQPAPSQQPQVKMTFTFK